eukprot:6871494-Lingulodinium_polyedra.AAC.1
MASAKQAHGQAWQMHGKRVASTRQTRGKRMANSWQVSGKRVANAAWQVQHNKRNMSRARQVQRAKCSMA